MALWLLNLVAAMFVASLAVTEAGSVEVVDRTWTNCSAECDGGNRTEAEKKKWVVPCHNIPCDLPQKCPCGAMDILLVVDRSQSIAEQNYWIVKQFIMDIAESMHRAHGSADTRFALVTFDKFITVEFEFSDGYNLTNLQAFKNDVWDLPYAPEEQGTVTADGLTEGDAMLKRRPEPLNTEVVVILTDGKSTQKGLMDEAITLIHGNGSRIIFGIGIGNNVEYSDIYQMTLADDKTFMANDFDALSAITSELSGDVCCEVAGVNCTGDWGPCSVSCGPGVTTKTEECITYNTIGQVTNKTTYTFTKECSNECVDKSLVPAAVDCTVVQNWSPCSVTCGTGVSTMAEECTTTNEMGEVISLDTEYSTKECCANECVDDECSAGSAASPPGMIHTFNDMLEFKSRGIDFEQGQLSLQIDNDAGVIRLYANVGGNWTALCEACM